MIQRLRNDGGYGCTDSATVPCSSLSLLLLLLQRTFGAALFVPRCQILGHFGVQPGFVSADDLQAQLPLSVDEL